MWPTSTSLTIKNNKIERKSWSPRIRKSLHGNWLSHVTRPGSANENLFHLDIQRYVIHEQKNALLRYAIASFSIVIFFNTFRYYYYILLFFLQRKQYFGKQSKNTNGSSLQYSFPASQYQYFSSWLYVFPENATLKISGIGTSDLNR